MFGSRVKIRDSMDIFKTITNASNEVWKSHPPKFLSFSELKSIMKTKSIQNCRRINTLRDLENIRRMFFSSTQITSDTAVAIINPEEKSYMGLFNGLSPTVNKKSAKEFLERCLEAQEYAFSLLDKDKLTDKTKDLYNVFVNKAHKALSVCNDLRYFDQRSIPNESLRGAADARDEYLEALEKGNESRNFKKVANIFRETF